MDQIDIDQIKKLSENPRYRKERKLCKVRQHIDAVRICYKIINGLYNTNIFYRLRIDKPMLPFCKYKVMIRFTRKQFYKNRIDSLLEQDYEEYVSFKMILHDKIEYKFDADILVHNYNLADDSNHTICSEKYDDTNDKGKIEYFRVYLL